MFNPETLKQRLVPDRKGSMANTPKEGYEKMCATGQVAYT